MADGARRSAVTGDEFRRLFVVDAWLAVFSTAGLDSALPGDGLWNTVCWLALALVVVVAVRACPTLGRMSRALPFQLRIRLGNAILGPGKAELLEGIRDTGSISAAGRGMQMSYRRAWQLVEELNLHFGAPVVATLTGGKGGGGAGLTPLGADVIATYRRMEAACGAAIDAEMAHLKQLRR